jgi:hypothetical protein
VGTNTSSKGQTTCAPAHADSPLPFGWHFHWHGKGPIHHDLLTAKVLFSHHQTMLGVLFMPFC